MQCHGGITSRLRYKVAYSIVLLVHPLIAILGQKYLAATVDVCIFDIVKQLLNTHNCYVVMLED